MTDRIASNIVTLELHGNACKHMPTVKVAPNLLTAWPASETREFPLTLPGKGQGLSALLTQTETAESLTSKTPLTWTRQQPDTVPVINMTCKASGRSTSASPVSRHVACLHGLLVKLPHINPRPERLQVSQRHFAYKGLSAVPQCSSGESPAIFPRCWDTFCLTVGAIRLSIDETSQAPWEPKVQNA